MGSINERLARIETKLGDMDKKLDTHLDRHFQVGLRSGIALLGSALAFIVAWFK